MTSQNLQLTYHTGRTAMPLNLISESGVKKKPSNETAAERDIRDIFIYLFIAFLQSARDT
jgi:hypothetical protein